MSQNSMCEKSYNLKKIEFRSVFKYFLELLGKDIFADTIETLGDHCLT